MTTYTGLTVRISEDQKFFTTAVRASKPKLVIKDLKLVAQFVLLKENLLSSINRSLATKHLQYPFFSYISKTFSIEVGTSIPSYITQKVYHFVEKAMTYQFYINRPLGKIHQYLTEGQ